MKKLLLLSIFLTGCTTYSQCPQAPYLVPLDLPIWHVQNNLSNSEIAKKIVESQKICIQHDTTCYNYLEDYMRKK